MTKYPQNLSSLFLYFPYKKDEGVKKEISDTNIVRRLNNEMLIAINSCNKYGRLRGRGKQKYNIVRFVCF